MTVESDIAAIATGESNTALEVRTALTSVLGSVPESTQYLTRRLADETANADDDFFDDGITTDYTELAVAGTAVWTEARGVVSVKALSGATGDAAVMVKPITATGPPYTIESRVGGLLQKIDFNVAGICFTDGTVASSNVVWLAQVVRTTGTNNIQVNTGTLTSINDTNRVTYNMDGNWGAPVYLRLVQTAANTWAANYSTDSVSWHDFALAPFSFTMTPTHFGLFVGQYNSATTPLMAAWDYLRMDEANLDV